MTIKSLLPHTHPHSQVLFWWRVCMEKSSSVLSIWFYPDWSIQKRPQKSIINLIFLNISWKLTILGSFLNFRWYFPLTPNTLPWSHFCHNNFIFLSSVEMVVQKFWEKDFFETTGCPKKNWTLGFLRFMVFPVTCENFRVHLDIIGGSYSKIKSCQVILMLFH